MRGADILAQCLKQDGQEIIFVLSGNQIMPIFDALFNHNIRLIHTRHEAGALFMAEGYAQISGKVGIALVTAGAGLGNAITPLITSMASQTPLLLISGDSPVSLDGKGAFQEMDQIALTQPVTKKSIRITNVNDLGWQVSEALALAKAGTPGPVHISLPVDILEDDGALAAHTPSAKRDMPDIGPIIAAINKASKPLIILGPSLAPVRTGYQNNSDGPPIIAMESPRGANDPSLGAFNKCWSEADLVVALDKPIDFSLGFGKETLWPKAEWITVHGCRQEVTRAQENLGARLVKAEQGEAEAILRAVLQITYGNDHQGEWRGQIDRLCNAKPQKQEGWAALNAYTLCEMAQSVITKADDPIIICDGGEFGQWAQALVRSSNRIINGVAGAIGGGFCYAIGAKLAAPGSKVFLLMGDGTAGFHFMEFETAAREEITFVSIIGNDRRWNAEHQIQLRQYGETRTHSCALSSARYDLAAIALGGAGFYITQCDQFAGALTAAMNSAKPACVNVEIQGLGYAPIIPAA